MQNDSSQSLSRLRIISAGAGSGKTYTLTQKMSSLLRPDETGQAQVRASGLIATTFTKKAAAELQERVRVKLLQEGLNEEADALGQALIGTVHSIGVQLLKRFAFEAGVSPNLDIIEDRDQQRIFNQSLATVLDLELTEELDHLSERLGMKKDTGFKKNKADAHIWRQELREIVDLARSNNLGIKGLQASRDYSLQSFFELLPQPNTRSEEAWEEELFHRLGQTIMDLEDQTEDSTKTTAGVLDDLRSLENQMRIQKGRIPWYIWVKIARICEKVGAKSRDLVKPLKEYALSHDEHPAFHADLRRYIGLLFDLGIATLDEYDRYKKTRGLIDYTDMEVLVLELLDNPLVGEVLSGELDLLLVDEFQDTNPIQLKIFLKLSQLAKQSIWVGDPKQSIYGFRGADPALMQAIIEQCPNPIEVLGHSWRSRQDLVHACNGLFVKAFEDSMPPERVALAVAPPLVKDLEPEGLDLAFQVWHLNPENPRSSSADWFMEQLVRALAQRLSEGNWQIRDRHSKLMRLVRPGDVAILCRTNDTCVKLAQALTALGLKASISRSGLIETAEAKLVLACLRYVLHPDDALSVAEIMLLSSKHALEEIIDDRLSYLQKRQEAKAGSGKEDRWGEDHEYIRALDGLRLQVREMSAAEILELVLERLELRRLLAAWPDAELRLSNIEALRSLALQHEASCNRMHSAATLGGFLLWLNDLAAEKQDNQASTEGPDVVQVLTYHKSKGLEWPIVLCFNLDGKIRDNLFGLHIVSDASALDLLDPLAGRLLRFWPNPYADQTKTRLAETMERHPAKLEARRQALEEEARLLYVGLTRARDYLVLPLHPRLETKWLNRVWHKGEESVPTFSPLDKSCPWLWLGQEIPIENLKFKEEDLNNLQGLSSERLAEYWEYRHGLQAHPPLRIEAHKDLFPQLQVQVLQQEQLYTLGNIEGDYAALGQMVQRFLLAKPAASPAEWEKQAENWLLEHESLQAQFGAKELARAAQKFQYKLLSLSAQWQKFLPFQWQNEKHFLRGQLSFFSPAQQGQSPLLLQILAPSLPDNPKKPKRLYEEGFVLQAAALSFNLSLEPRLFILNALEGLLLELKVR